MQFLFPLFLFLPKSNDSLNYPKPMNSLTCEQNTYKVQSQPMNSTKIKCSANNIDSTVYQTLKHVSANVSLNSCV